MLAGPAGVQGAGAPSLFDRLPPRKRASSPSRYRDNDQHREMQRQSARGKASPPSPAVSPGPSPSTDPGGTSMWRGGATGAAKRPPLPSAPSFHLMESDSKISPPPRTRRSVTGIVSNFNLGVQI